MELLKHLSIDLFPVVMLLTIFINNQKRADKTAGDRLFNVLTLSAITLMVTDILCYSTNSAYGHSVGGFYILHILHMLVMVTVPFVWLLYAYHKLVNRNPGRWLEFARYAAFGVVVLSSVLILTTPCTHLVFYITRAGYYKAGSFVVLPNLVSELLFLGSAVVAGIAYTHEVTKEGHKEVVYMIDFAIVSLVGIGIQHLFKGWWTAGPFIALAILFIYINTQNHQITTDALTGLNNRREFDAQLARKIELYPEHEWGLLMIDVDEFKRINDQLGHAVGDEALWETADILRHVFGKERVLLARYGGDEFTVIGDWYDEKEVSTSMEKVRQEVQKFNESRKAPYELSLSIGYAFWHEAGRREENLIKTADQRMYEEKVRKKKVRV